MNERSLLGRIISGYYRLLQVLVTCLMGLLIVPVTLQIVSRYTGIIPRYIWTEEAARLFFMWVIMIGAMIAVRDGTHFEVDVLPTPANPKREAILRLIVYGFMFIFSGVFVLYGYDYAVFGYAQTSELTGINLTFIYGMYFVAGLTWFLFLTERVLAAIAVIRGDHSRLPFLRGDHNVAR
jgi:TRAP-type transport system small permease protein